VVIKLAILPITLATCLFTGLFGATPAPTDYAQWVDRYTDPNLKRAKTADDHPAQPPKVVITNVVNELETKSRPNVTYFKLLPNGEMWGISVSDSGVKSGNSDHTLSAGELKHLDELTAKLPDDHSQLPPPGRRIMLQFIDVDHLQTRIYDLANLPDGAWEILRMSRSRIPAWAPKFKPQSEIDTKDDETVGDFCLSPDGRRMFFALCNSGHRQVWDTASRQLVVATPGTGEAGSGAAFSPDGSLIIQGGTDCFCLDTATGKIIQKLSEPPSDGRLYDLSSPQFTPDGRFLALQDSRPSVDIYDTRTWQKVSGLPEIPENALQFIPSPNWSRSVIASKTEGIVLWDIIYRRKIAVLSANGYLSYASFSPDSSLVAVVIKPQKGLTDRDPRIRIFRTDTGGLVRELNLYETGTSDDVEGLLWSPEGHYVFAVIKPDFFFSTRELDAFNIQTGHFRGDFTSGAGTVCGLALLPGGDQLVAGCTNGKIYFWDLADGLKEIKAFEALLPPMQ